MKDHSHRGAFINYVVMSGEGQKFPNFDNVPLYESIYVGGRGVKKFQIYDYVV